MKKAFSFLIFMSVSICLFSEQPVVTQRNHPENIQVLLAKNIDEALLESKGPYVVFNPHDGTKITTSLSGKRFMVKPTPNGVKWGEEYPGIHQIYVVPKNKNCSLLVNGIEYDGAITIISIKNKINVINDVAIESYLKSILTPQFPYPLENEVMAAIAIAARTTAYAHVKRNKDAFWHVSCEDVNYQGKAIVIPDSHISNAVERTKDLILVLSEGGENKPFAATWTENSAGKTAPFHTIFRKDWWAPKSGVEAPHAAMNREESKWTYKISKKSFSNLFSISSLTGIDLYTEPFSKKTYALKIKDGGNSKDLDFVTFQQIIGSENIVSNDIQVNVSNNEIVFTGYGKGMGVGLCLHSATQMAQNGDNAAKILSKFFPDTFLLNLSAIPRMETK